MVVEEDVMVMVVVEEEDGPSRTERCEPAQVPVLSAVSWRRLPY